MANNQQTHPRAIPLHLAHLIGLNVEFEVLVCLGSHCSKAVSGPGMDKHLRTYHGIKPKIRSQVNEYIKEFPFDYNYATIKLPRDGLAPQPWIPVVDGLHCKKCTYRTQRRDGIKKHGNKEHAMKRVQDNELFDRVKLQSWFRDGKERYWVVDESKQSGQPAQPGQSIAASQSNGNSDNGHGDHPEGSDSQEESDNQEEVDDQIARDLKQKAVAAKERRMELLSKVPTDQLDPWLRYTEWNEVLQKSSHNIIETHRFTRKPDIDEPDLIRISAAWERILNRCLDTLAANDHKDTLKWWASPKNEIASQRPFELPQNARTITKYSGYFQQFICYAMRTAPRTWGEESETGVKFTHQQWKKIERIRITCQTNVPEDSETDEKEQDQLLTTRLMGFCISVIRQDMGQLKVYDSPLMHFLAVMGVDSQTRSFKSSFLYTPVLAGMLYINRLIMLEVAVPEEAWPMLVARKDHEDVLQRIQEIRRAFLCEGSFSPTSSILSQLAMGKSLNRKHKSESNIHWSEDEQTIFYHGQGVQLGKITTMCQELTRELQEMLRWLLFDEEPAPIDLGKIIDSMAWSQEFRRDGYSFIQHPQNRGVTDVGYQFLLSRARNTRGDRQMMRKDGTANQGMQWIDQRVQQYLQYERGFLQTAMGAVHTEYGQPGRGPELGSVKVSNSIYSARNFYVLNGRACILTTYDKSQKRRGNTEFIVRFLPDEISQVLVQYLVKVRPFARALDGRESEYLFADLRGPWAGSELTHELRRVTRKYLGAELRSSGWRHVAIGIAVRHLIRASKTWDTEEAEGQEDVFAEGEDDEELEADTFQHVMIRQASHGVRVAQNHYAIDGAFLHRLGPELLSTYEKASVAWHELFHIKSEGARVAK